VSRLRTAGRSGRWRYMADLLHLLDQPALRNAFFPPEEEAPPVEPAGADDLDQIFAIAELRDGPDERARIEVWAQRLPHRFSVARGSEGEVSAFYLFARQDDPHSGLGVVDPLFAAWQAHLAANPVEGEVLFIRQMSARGDGAHPAGRTACILDLKRHYIERQRMARIYCRAFADDRDLLHRLGFRPLERPQAAISDTMVLEVPGGDMIEWVWALVDAGTRGIAHGDDLGFARDYPVETREEAFAGTLRGGNFKDTSASVIRYRNVAEDVDSRDYFLELGREFLHNVERAIDALRLGRIGDRPLKAKAKSPCGLVTRHPAHRACDAHPETPAAALRDSPLKTTASTTRLRRSSESALPAASFQRQRASIRTQAIWESPNRFRPFGYRSSHNP
jgi:hypothetical protein